MERAIEDIGARVSVLDAQTYLQEWYERFGYVVTGPEFLDDGIPHVPMRRPG
jgi:ElaA protein